MSCPACMGNVAAGKSCYACGRPGPAGQGIVAPPVPPAEPVDTTKAKDEARARAFMFATDIGGRIPMTPHFVKLFQEVRAERDAEWSNAWLAFVRQIGKSFTNQLSTPGDLAPYLLMHKEHEAERDAELQRAMVVASRCVEDCQKEGICWFCEWSPTNGFPTHDADCPLVSQGFITPTGERK